MSATLRSHLRGNAVGYLALFVALSGSAYAAHVAGKNTVSSKSIRNGQVKSVDLQDNGVLTGDIQDGAVQSGDVQDGGIQGIDLAPGAIGPANLAADAIGAPGFARVSGTTANPSRGVVGVQHANGSGVFCFDLSFTPQVGVASVDAGVGDGNATATVQVPTSVAGPTGGCTSPFTDAGVATTNGTSVTDENFYVIFD